MTSKRSLLFFTVWVVGLLALLLYPPCTANNTALGIGHYFITDVGAMVNVEGVMFGRSIPTIDWGKLILEALIWSLVIGAAGVIDNYRQKARG